MRKTIIFQSILTIIVLTFFMVPAFGDAWYIRPGGGNYGLENGTSWSDAFDGFTDISWSDVSPGDFIYMSGGPYFEKLSVSASGSENMPITIKRATASDHGSDSGWQPQFDSPLNIETASGQGAAIDMSGRTISWVTIDGSTRDGIQILWRDGIGGINMFSGSTDTVSNITLKNIKVDGSLTTDSRGIYLRQGGASSGKFLNNITLDSLTFVKITNDPIIIFGVHNLLIQKCTIKERTPTPIHADALEVWYGNEHVVVRQNTFNWNGQNIFFNGSSGDSGGNRDWYIYSNLFYNDGTWTNASDQVAIKSQSGNPYVEGPVYFTNNTVVDYRLLTGFGSNAHAFFYNNISWNNTVAPHWNDNTVHEYNFYNPGGSSGESNQVIGNDPFSDYTSKDLTLSAGSDAIAVGINLNFLPELQKDFFGRLRDISGPWDMGAYKITGSSDVLAPAPPILIGLTE